jgi:YbbR domain-containing protein
MAYFPFRNVGLKFLSICIAALLWLVIAGDRIVERGMRVPVEYQNLPAGLEMVGDPVDVVDVRLRGSSGTIGRLSPADMSAVVDLRSARPGRRLFHLTASQVIIPYGVEVVQVTPATLPIEFENSAVRIVQVRPSLEGAPPPGYEVLNVTTTPATVEVIGPESSLRGLDEAMTEPVTIADQRRPVREVVTVGVADPTVRLRTPQTATVIVQIGPGTSTRTLTGVSVAVINAESGVHVRPLPATISVGLKGTREDIETATPEVIQAQVDVAGLAPGEHTVEVKVRARVGLTIDAITPPSVRVRITKP